MDISIVTPVFNSVRWIELCLQSVRYALQGQSYEHIVVDGGSTDGTLEYLKQQKDIRLIPGPDKGMYDALNKGMAAARGRILGHLNADEQYDRAGLAHALEKLDQTAADAVFGPTIMLDEHLNFLYLFNQITVPRPIDAELVDDARGAGPKRAGDRDVVRVPVAAECPGQKSVVEAQPHVHCMRALPAGSAVAAAGQFDVAVGRQPEILAPLRPASFHLLLRAWMRGHAASDEDEPPIAAPGHQCILVVPERATQCGLGGEEQHVLPVIAVEVAHRHGLDRR